MRQNKITEYRKMLLAWKKAGTITVAGYILGFPFDTPDSIREDLKIIQKELPLDFLEFFCLTPLPGSQDHQTLYRKGEWMHEDLNLYDGEHAAMHHPKMTKEEWEEIYRTAWTTFYTPEHMATIMRRGAATNCSQSRMVGLMFLSRTSVPVETRIRCRAVCCAGNTGSTAGPACRSSRSGRSIPNTPGASRAMAGTSCG